jgi:putative transposase
MTEKRRCWDNIFIERLWCSVKYEDVYLKEYASGVELCGGLEKYFGQYNKKRPHKALDKKTQKQVYEG